MPCHARARECFRGCERRGCDGGARLSHAGTAVRAMEQVAGLDAPAQSMRMSVTSSFCSTFSFTTTATACDSRGENYIFAERVSWRSRGVQSSSLIRASACANWSFVFRTGRNKPTLYCYGSYPQTAHAPRRHAVAHTGSSRVEK